MDELAKALDMTLMGVRLHLVVVERDGYVRRSTLRQKPGRPALVYSLTPKAEEIFPKRYDLLAEKLLEALQREGAADADGVLEATAHAIATTLAGQLNGVVGAERVEQVGRMLDELGAFVTWERAEGGYLLHQHNCLFYRVAQRNRDVCAMDGIFLRHLLGTDAERRECIVDGAGRCSYFVPVPSDE